MEMYAPYTIYVAACCKHVKISFTYEVTSVKGDSPNVILFRGDNMEHQSTTVSNKLFPEPLLDRSKSPFPWYILNIVEQNQLA